MCFPVFFYLPHRSQSLRGIRHIVDLIYSGSSCLPGSSVSSATSSCTTLVEPTQRTSPLADPPPSLLNLLHSLTHSLTSSLVRVISAWEKQRRWPRLDTDPQWCRWWYLPRLRQCHGPGLRPARGLGYCNFEPFALDAALRCNWVSCWSVILFRHPVRWTWALTVFLLMLIAGSVWT